MDNKCALKIWHRYIFLAASLDDFNYISRDTHKIIKKLHGHMYIKLLKCPSAVVLSYIHTATCHDIKYVHNYYHECDFNKSFYLTIFNVSYRKPSLRTLTQSFNLQRYESFNII